MSRILIVEDDKRLLRAIRDGLAEEGYETVTSLHGPGALYAARSQPLDLIILDLMLPGAHGLDVLRQMRAEGIFTPVLILSASERVHDRVSGLDSGADDYLVKPFSYAELLARIRALLRRGRSSETLELVAGTIRFDLLKRRVFRQDVELALSRRECDLLECLIRNQGQTVSRDMLAKQIWQDPQVVYTNVIDVFINRLRRKLETDGEPSLILTVRGIGYTIRRQGQ